MNVQDLPSLSTYSDIFIGIGKTFFNVGRCKIWAQPQWATFVITYLSILFIFIYLYVLFFGIIRSRSRLSPVFYRAIGVLAIGDLVVLICSMRESVTQDCVLGFKPARHIAWQSLGTFAVEIIVGANFVLSFTRAVSIWGHEKISNMISSLLLILVVFWASALSVMNHFGLVDAVWFSHDNEYHDAFLSPFDVIRMPLLFSEVGLTAIFYIISALSIRRMFRFYNRRTIRGEMKLLILSLLIFFIELEFIYATFWIGDYFSIGSSEFNANLDYTSRPIATGLTPFIYIACSVEIRRSLKTSFPFVYFFNKEPERIVTQTMTVK